MKPGFESLKYVMFGIVVLQLFASSVSAAAVSIGTDYAVVSDDRTVTLDTGINTLALDFPKGAMPESIVISSACLKTLTQNYDAGMGAGYGQLTDKTVTVKLESGTEYTGKIISMDGSSVILEASSTTYVFPVEKIDSIIYAGPSSPKLKLTVDSSCSGDKSVSLLYMTQGFGWEADYVGVYDRGRFSLYGLARITNNAGTFNNADVTLIAGDINRVSTQNYYPMYKTYDYAMAGAAAPSEAEYATTQTKTAFEYHAYHVPAPVDLIYGETSVVSLVNIDVVADKKFTYTIPAYLYNSGASDAPIDVSLEFANSATNGGAALPAGIVRMYTDNGFSGYMLAGEDQIGNVPVGENVTLSVGKAFDILGNVKNMEHNEFLATTVDTYEVTLKNRKNESVAVKVIGEMPSWSNWEITKSDHDYTKESASRVYWMIDIPANSEETLTYTVREWY